MHVPTPASVKKLIDSKKLLSDEERGTLINRLEKNLASSPAPASSPSPSSKKTPGEPSSTSSTTKIREKKGPRFRETGLTHNPFQENAALRALASQSEED